MDNLTAAFKKKFDALRTKARRDTRVLELITQNVDTAAYGDDPVIVPSWLKDGSRIQVIQEDDMPDELLMSAQLRLAGRMFTPKSRTAPETPTKRIWIFTLQRTGE